MLVGVVTLGLVVFDCRVGLLVDEMKVSGAVLHGMIATPAVRLVGRRGRHA